MSKNSDPKTSVIKGRVFEDTDRDNTEFLASGGYEPGIAGQTVQLLSTSGSVLRTQTTDASGNYSFTHLAKGDYVVRFPTQIGDRTLVQKDVGAESGDSDADQTTGKTVSIHLGKASTVSEIDAGYRDDTPPPDGIVSGTAGNDRIDINYTGDPEGDRIDNNDAILPGQSGNMDIVDAGCGDDTVQAGLGDDMVFAGGGNDSVRGGEGNDTIYGDASLGTTDGPTATPLTLMASNVQAGSQTGVDGCAVAGNSVVYRDVAVTDDGRTVMGKLVLVHASGGLNVDLTGGPGSEILLNGNNDANDAGKTATFRLEFFDQATGQPIAISSIATFGDLDRTATPERVTIDGSQYSAYGTASDTSLAVTTSSGKVIASGTEENDPSDQDAWFSAAFEGRSSIEFTLTTREVNSGYTLNGAVIDQPALVDLCPPGNDTLFGGNGDDVIYGEDGNDKLYGEAGNDTLDGGCGDDSLYGGTGADLMIGGSGNDSIRGGDGNDTIYGDAVDGSGGTGTTGPGDFDRIALNFASVRAGSETAAHPNTAVAGSSVVYDNVATLADGTQVSARMVLVTKTSAHLQVDMANSTDYEVLLNANNNSAMEGQSATFRLEFFNTATGAPVIIEPGIVFADLDRNVGSEIIRITDTNLVNVGVPTASSLNVTYASGSLVARGTEDNINPNDLDSQVSTLFGPTSSVTFTMTARGVNSGLNFGTIDGQTFNYLSPFDACTPGNDFIDGGVGDDVIYGGEGNDTVYFNEGSDTVYGGAGNDLIDDRAGAIIGGNNLVYGGEGRDTIYVGSGQDTVYGDEGDDRIFGEGGNNLIYGGDGNDSIYAGVGNDTLFGDDGNDSIKGGAGDDVIYGGAGNNALFGGDDRDVIYGTSGDSVDGGAGGTDFDILDVTGQGPYVLQNVTPDSNGNGINGTLVFVDVDGVPTGQTIVFTEIEEIRGTPFNTAPAAVDDTLSVDEDDVLTGNVLANDTDPDGDPLTVIGNTNPSNGSLVINPDGSFTYTPDADYNGSDSFTYTVSDGKGGTDTATVTLTVNPVNDAPVAADDAVTTDEDVPVTIDVLANDSDPDGDTLSVMDASAPNGTVVVNPDGTLTYTPDQDYNGTDTITYTVSDGFGGTDTATVTVTVTPVNDAPDAVDDSASTTSVTPVIINVLVNDTDVDGDTLTVIGNTDPSNGTVTLLADGTFEYIPARGFAGTDTFTYTVSDGQGGTDTATVTVTVGDTRDGIVFGTAGDDFIGTNSPLNPGFVYTGDPEGDLVDSEDALLSGAAPNDDVIFGFEGNDTIDAGLGNDEVYGGADDDLIYGREGDDTLSGDAGTDTIYGGEGDDIVYGGEGNDSIRGNEGNDTLFGGAGDDTIRGGEDDDLIYGGDGKDVLIGGEGDDTIYGGDGDDSIRGVDGDDLIFGGDGNDTILGEEGRDTVYGGSGDDYIDTSSRPGFSNPLPDIGYPGFYPADPDPEDDRDLVYGGDGNDTILTGDDADTIFGGAGDDYIDGGIDADLIHGDEGDDTIIGGEGADTIYGGAGNDLIYGGLPPGFPDFVNVPDETDLRPENNIDLIFGGAGDDTIFGADDADMLFGDEGDDYIDGQVDNDSIYGGLGNDTLIGGHGDDLLDGGEGDDQLFGGDGNDIVYGGAGNDTIVGGEGNNQLFGGDDRDLFTNATIGDVVDGGAGGDDYDILDLQGTAPVGGSLNVVLTGPDSNGNGFDGYVIYRDDTGTEIGRVDFTEIEEIVPCFTPGTTIATPKGERLVEELRVGDRVITRDNGIQEIRWIGAKPVSGLDLARNPHLKPVLIRKGALGNGLPERDMLVSPNHRLLVNNDKTALYFEEREVLAAAKHLVGADGIHEVDVMGTTYIHFMFDHHEVVLSNGSWTESFQPGDMSLKGIGNAQRNEIFELFPELRSQDGITEYQAARRSLKKHEAKLLIK